MIFIEDEPEASLSGGSRHDIGIKRAKKLRLYYRGMRIFDGLTGDTMSRDRKADLWTRKSPSICGLLSFFILLFYFFETKRSTNPSANLFRVIRSTKASFTSTYSRIYPISLSRQAMRIEASIRRGAVHPSKELSSSMKKK